MQHHVHQHLCEICWYIKSPGEGVKGGCVDLPAHVDVHGGVEPAGGGGDGDAVAGGPPDLPLDVLHGEAGHGEAGAGSPSIPRSPGELAALTASGRRGPGGPGAPGRGLVCRAPGAGRPPGEPQQGGARPPHLNPF